MQPNLVKLASGINAIFAPCEAESAAIGVFVGSGSRHESPKVAGISHFIEHMLFKGTPTRSSLDIIRAIEGRGGNFNAYTGEEATCFFAHLPDEYLFEAIDILADMYLNASIDEDEFGKEKHVVIEEIRMYRDEPDSVAAENLQRSIFPRNQLGAPIAGSEESLIALVPEDLKKYIDSHYLPFNTVIVVAGAFDEEKTLEKLNVAFPKNFRKNTKFIAEKVDFSIPPVSEVRVSKELNQMQLAVGFRTFGIMDERRYASTVLDGVLGRGMSSRLFQEVREKRGLSYDISSRWQFFQDAGIFTITAGLDKSKATGALKVIERELEKVAARKISKAELERTKEYLTGNFRLSNEKVLSKMIFYGTGFLSFGKLVTPREQVERVRAVSADDVLLVAQEVLDAKNRSLSWVVPR